MLVKNTHLCRGLACDEFSAVPVWKITRIYDARNYPQSVSMAELGQLKDFFTEAKFKTSELWE